ncbi:putative phage replication protein [Acinetobacter baumannii]|nr:putative phage replication protein [Acinetobacter baumannii]MDH1309911.1 putative phage replication protein [Acinetobacter baumannii]
MNKFEILAWAMLISCISAVLCGVVVLWWLARKELDEKGARHESN